MPSWFGLPPFRRRWPVAAPDGLSRNRRAFVVRAVARRRHRLRRPRRCHARSRRERPSTPSARRDWYGRPWGAPSRAFAGATVSRRGMHFDTGDILFLDTRERIVIAWRGAERVT